MVMSTNDDDDDDDAKWLIICEARSVSQCVLTKRFAITFHTATAQSAV